jgi:peptidylprolyl isomerase
MRAFRLLTPFLALTLALPVVACGDDDDPVGPGTAATVETTTFAPALGVDLNAAGWTKTNTGLWYRTLNTPAATAATVTAGQSPTVRYTGWLSSGQQFESNTITRPIGVGQLIAGWDQGIVGMKVGERRRLLIPPSLGYGAGGSGPIPGNAVLVFDVEVQSVQ